MPKPHPRARFRQLVLSQPCSNLIQPLCSRLCWHSCPLPKVVSTPTTRPHRPCSWPSPSSQACFLHLAQSLPSSPKYPERKPPLPPPHKGPGKEPTSESVQHMLPPFCPFFLQGLVSGPQAARQSVSLPMFSPGGGCRPRERSRLAAGGWIPWPELTPADPASAVSCGLCYNRGREEVIPENQDCSLAVPRVAECSPVPPSVPSCGFILPPARPLVCPFPSLPWMHLRWALEIPY